MSTASKQLLQTPSQTVGPFFHYGLVRSGENVLVGKQVGTPAVILTGFVYDGDGAAIPDALLEIWQADQQGYFKHERDPNHAKADPNFAHFGRSDTASNGEPGRYKFKTVKPGAIVAEGDSVPYVNVRVFARGMLTHALTRMYFPEENNRKDEVFASVDSALQERLVARLDDSYGLRIYHLDIHMQGVKESVFFTP